MTVVSDNFNRADSTSLGGSWTEIVGDWAIASNQVECNDDDGGTGYYARYETDVGSTDMYAELDANPAQANGNSNTGVAVRMRSGANTSYQFTTNDPNNSCAFWRIVAGSEAQITGANNALTFTTPITVGDRIRLEVTASTLRARVNGALVALARDTNISDGQRGGLNGYNNVGTDVVRVDNFEAGAFSDDPPLAPYIHTWVTFGAGTVTPRTPGLPSTTGHIANGDLILAWLTVCDSAQTITPDAAEGWTTIQTPSQTGLESTLMAKVWGLGGQTDDLTPEFSVGDASSGFGVTLAVIRNPQHSTAPWTSVASAIVASGEQSNTANNTVTAPSVSHSGTHRTVGRFYSSADDNNLGVPSEGLLVFGGTPWHTTQGNDFAQAFSILEDTTLASSTGTATVTEGSAGPDVSNGVTIVVAIPGGATVNATLAAAFGGAASASATVDHPAVLTSSLGGAATATAAVEHPATLAASFGGAASATATRDTAATAAAAFGWTASGNATPDHPATLTASLGGEAAAAATVTQLATAATDLGFAAVATATVTGEEIAATLEALLGGSAVATATVDHPATAVAAFGGFAAATATPDHPATLAADLGAAATATAVLDHAATASASGGFVATAAAGVVRADPNPTVVRVRESNPTISDSRVQRLRETA